MRNLRLTTTFLLALFSVCANATPFDDSTAMTGWTGTQSINLTYGTRTLNFEVQYAVFDQGDYTTAGGFDNSGGTDYVYAYRIYNKPGANTINYLSIAIPDGFSINPTSPYIDPTYTGASGDKNPTSYDLSSSVGFFFGGTSAIAADQYSTMLLFTSSYGPSPDAEGNISGSGMGANFAIVSIPEPATMALLAPAIWALRRRKQK